LAEFNTAANGSQVIDRLEGLSLNPFYTTKHWLKLLRWQIRRMLAARRWGAYNLDNAPAVLGNAMPKSGSHLIIQVLQGLVELGPFVNPGFPPVNRSEDNHKLPDQAVLKNLLRMHSGDIAYGYIQAREPFISALTGTGNSRRATVFVYRDPRDFIVSQVFYAAEIHKGHGMHRYYTEVLHSMEERINTAIQGVGEEDASGEDWEGSPLSDVLTKYEKYMGWMQQTDVLCLRFEDLILERDMALGRLLDYLSKRGFTPRISSQQAVESLKRAIMPRKSGTFRKGSPGNWREHFTEANKTIFKQVTGDLLVRLGYEQGYNW